MLAWLGTAVMRFRWPVLGGALVALVVAGLAAGGVTDRLAAGAFDDSGPEARRAKRILEQTFRSGEPNLVLLVTANSGSVDDPGAAAAGRALTTELAAQPGVTEVNSYWTTGLAPLRSTDGRKAVVAARIVGDDKAVEQRAGELSSRFTRQTGDVGVAVGGSAEVFREINSRSDEDLVRAEMVAGPITLVLLVIILGGVVAGLLPLLVGAFTVLETLLILYVLGGVTDVSVFALNLTTALGLGLAIDYSLFILSRFRESLAAGAEVRVAVRHAVATAGKTILVSGIAVAGSLAALLVFDQMFLRSIAYAGIAVVACATVASVVVLPALLAILGHGVNRLSVRRHALSGEGRGWHRIAVTVMRFPVPFAVAAVALLLLLGAPFLNIKFGDTDDRALPTTSSARQVSDQLRTDFASRELDAIAVVAEGLDAARVRGPEVEGYATRLSAQAGVGRVDTVTGSYADGGRVTDPGPLTERYAVNGSVWIQVVPAVEPVSPEGEALVRRLRAVPAPFPVLMTGPSVELVDGKAAITDRLPVAGVLIAGSTFLVLLVVFGSVLVPIKALVLNVLSLTAAFGALVWGFQEGNLAGLLNFTATGTTEISIPVLLFFLAFGLSMDYEVFLLSRIKEEYDRSGDNQGSVALGLQRSGPVITAAATLIAVVFAGLATSSVTVVKLLGVGLAIAIVMDATVVRAVLVPAFMRLAGAANWWAPRPVQVLHRKLGIHAEEGTVPEPRREEVARASH
jgi:RND superfamily putative drug exporter